MRDKERSLAGRTLDELFFRLQAEAVLARARVKLFNLRGHNQSVGNQDTTEGSSERRVHCKSDDCDAHKSHYDDRRE